ncbi:hypothetical protein A3F00_01270 [Candidatus Daviesbacteria bacterium RIFCSPHIGHO2_12_FULL_37_11]|uniref:Uncharacterized protein n=1 Tax=Candidatus Daviesbacteria bacterium RIFCSPHIGHO2_12_FULL_37_11 TaxID=1797777 RepID=A0A1F5K9I3_9BACT|nr:MAG: hypothetical protein A3F00_01270 [Candidatus Daviesbacteria bacterium RIFCSPHIGHO2_12_FULL_37_11]OGE46003.1 MAG: hypothetical protein A3B39_04340 [Candidatus Daviesbacteria bacterium RIFCSPLOWO2_01_FULL_37_10]
MDYESGINKLGLSPANIETGGFNIVTTGKEKTIYVDVLTAGREIGSQKLWGWTKLLVGGGAFLITDVTLIASLAWSLFDKTSQLDLNRVAVVTGLAIGAYYTAKDGNRDINITSSKDKAIKNVPFGVGVNLIQESLSEGEETQQPSQTVTN